MKHRIFGTFSQVSYVVRDLDAAIEHWARVMNVGPFFVIDHVEYEEFLYRNEPSPVDMAVAMAYNGDLQIELVQQHNDAPSLFRDFLERHGEGLIHLGGTTDDLARDLALLREKGVEPLQQGLASDGTRFAYLSTDFHPGAMMELVETNPRLERAFEAMRRAAREWDGEVAIAFRR